MLAGALIYQEASHKEVKIPKEGSCNLEVLGYIVSTEFLFDQFQVLRETHDPLLYPTFACSSEAVQRARPIVGSIDLHKVEALFDRLSYVW